MPYKATGAPPGRPKKTVEPEAPAEGLTLCPCGCGAYTANPIAATRFDTTRTNIPFELAPCCSVCNPDGWPEGVTGYGCEHGIWARRV